jgi:hypothetical protein
LIQRDQEQHQERERENVTSYVDCNRASHQFPLDVQTRTC